MTTKKDAPKSVWETLSRIDVSDHTEEKNGFTYLSWAWAWQTLKEHYPHARFVKHHDVETGLPYFKDGETGNAFVRVTVDTGASPDGEREEATETFPVLNYANKSIANPDSMEINTALQRCMTKAISYLGLGAYIYAGEDLPPGPREVKITHEKETKTATGPEMVHSIFEAFVGAMDTVEKLEGFWVSNKAAIDVLKTDKDKYADILTKFKKQKTALTKKEEKENA